MEVGEPEQTQGRSLLLHICCLGTQGWGGDTRDNSQGLENSGQWGGQGSHVVPSCPAPRWCEGIGHSLWRLQHSSFYQTSPFFTRSRTFWVFGRHSGEKAEWVAGEQNFFSSEKPLLTDPGLPQLPAKWSAHLGRRVSSGAHGSSSAALNPSVLPSQDLRARLGQLSQCRPDLPLTHCFPLQ